MTPTLLWFLLSLIVTYYYFLMLLITSFLKYIKSWSKCQVIRTIKALKVTYLIYSFHQILHLKEIPIDSYCLPLIQGTISSFISYVHGAFIAGVEAEIIHLTLYHRVSEQKPHFPRVIYKEVTATTSGTCYFFYPFTHTNNLL